MDAIGNGPARRFYFYFSGHGFAQLQTNSHLCLAKWSDKRRNNALDAKSYLNYILATGQFDEVMFFMDCCRIREVNAEGLKCSLGNPKPKNNPKTRIFES